MNRNLSFLIICSYSLTIFFTQLSYATQKSSLPKITVYGARHKNKTYTVISPKEANNFQYKHLTDILNHSPSFNYSERSIFYRATNTQHTRLFVEDIEFNDLTSYNQSLDSSFVTTDTTSHISLNDPISASNSDTIGANIQINSEKGKGETSQFALVEYGSRDTSTLEYNIQGEKRDLDFNITMKNEATKGIITKPKHLRSKSRHHEPDGVHKMNYSSRFGLQCTPHVRIQTFHRGFSNDSEYVHFEANTPSGLSTLKNQLNKIELIHDATRRQIKNKISVYNLDFKRNQRILENPAVENYVNSQQKGLHLEHSQTINPLYAFLIKTEVHEHVLTSTLLKKKSVKYKGIHSHSFCFSRNNKFHFKNTVTKSNKNNDFNYSLVYEHYLPQTKTTINLTHKTASLEPSLMQLYIPQWGGNPDLKTEKSVIDQIDLVQLLTNNLVVSMSVFHQNLKDLIYSTRMDENQWKLKNIGKTQSHGSEIKLKYNMLNWQFSLGYSYLEFKNLFDSSILIRRPRHIYSASLLHENDDFLKGIQVSFKRNEYDSDSMNWNSPKMYHSPPIFRVFASKKIYSYPNLWLFCRAENIFNRYYESPKEYIKEGVGIFVGFKTNIHS
ncbi:MAG: hypothetical protein C0432_05115 [Candidatus Puniceispirillum sp.]|nr:hypothetical protein [Candidatus Pelagibacter sp.]MBA4283655.1 hypothetical protein [Candidatus Puniceispirillum sp.]